jgi:1-acyl-sn-glycerol-3-phosphate acyltransferase
MNSGVHPLAGIIAGAARLITGVNVRWLDSRPDTTQRVYFANHTSHLDFVVLWSSLPQEVRALTRPVAAQDYWEKGVRHALAVNIFKAVLVARRNAASEATPGEAVAAARRIIDHLAEAMGEHSSLIIFPEGTRGSGEEVGAFKSGLYYLCQRKPVLQLVPAYLNNLNRILPKGEFLPVPFISQLTFGPPMMLEPGEPKAAFLVRAREAVCRLRQI